MNNQTKIKNLLILFICTLSHTAYAQRVSSYSIETNFFPIDAKMYGYPVSNEAFMNAVTHVEFSDLKSGELSFYLHGELKIDSLISGNNSINYHSEKIHDRRDYSRVVLKTTIEPSSISNMTLKVYYSGFMNPSRARSLSDYMRINIEEGVFLRSYGYSLWFPVFLEPEQEDYPVNIKKIRVSLPEKFKSVVIGELEKEAVSNGVYTAIWHPGIVKLINVQCTAREFEVMSKDNVNVYYLNDKSQAEKIITYTGMMKLLYFNKFREVQDTSSLYILELPKFGNISSHNVIGIASDLYTNFEDNLSSKITIAHELVHPYVQIPVSRKDPLAALIVEGFPSFFHLYGLEKTMSRDVFDLEKYMRNIEASYIKKKNTGKDRRGNQLPPEKPIVEISYDDIGKYKDQFILSDRARLFLYHLWTTMGDQHYDQFLKELFMLKAIDYDKFEKIVVKYLPGYQETLHIWLNTVDYPKTFHLDQ